MPNSTRRLTNDPVRWANTLTGLTGSVVAALVVGQVIAELTAGIVIAISTALNIAVGELFVRPETVPRQPLEQWADRHPQVPPLPDPPSG